MNYTIDDHDEASWLRTRAQVGEAWHAVALLDALLAEISYALGVRPSGIVSRWL